MNELNEKMTAIANEIRELNGGTEKLGLDAMATNVSEGNAEITLQSELLELAIAELEGKVDPELYNRGYAAGYEEGNGEGYDRGYAAGYEEGNGEGYNRGCSALVAGGINKLDISTEHIQRYALSWKPLLNKLIIRSSSIVQIDDTQFIGTPVCKYVSGNISRSYTRKLWETEYGKYTYTTAFTGLTGKAGDLVYFDGTISDEAHKPCWIFGLCTGSSNFYSHYWTDDETEANALKSGSCGIYVPNELVEQYKSATNWSTYASQIKPISELEV